MKSCNMPLIDVNVIDAAIACWKIDKQYTQLIEECGEYITEAMQRVQDRIELLANWGPI